MPTNPGYDVLIVGGGSAGCVLAARLSEDPSRRVLLLEAGKDHWPGDVFPELVDGGHGPCFDPNFDWGLRGCAGIDGRTIDIARGRVIGGCSAMNAAFALRGSVHDYDSWAAAGNPGWSFADLLPALCRLEADVDFGSAAFHGSSGPIPIHRRRDRPPSAWARAVADSMTAVGLPVADDLNAPHAHGVGALPANTREGRRISTAIGYLDPARDRPNLDVRCDVVVDRVQFDRAGRARGAVLVGGEVVPAEHVILAAGAFMSPAVLLRSGIGPADDTRALGGEVRVDLPGVGNNLADHPAISIDVPIIEGVVPTWFSETLALVHSSNVDAATHAPDLQLLSGGPFGDNADVAFLASALMKPVSRGTVRLASLDPDVQPVIDLGYYRDSVDLDRVLEGLEIIEGILAESPIKAVTGGGRHTPRMRNDGEGRAAALANTWTYFHPVGTCAMGPDPGAGAVVDASLRVYGVDGLSVVDASIMPSIVAANTNVTTIAIAERYVELCRSQQG